MNNAETHQTAGFGRSVPGRPQRSVAPALKATSQPPAFQPKYKTELRNPETLVQEDPSKRDKRAFNWSFLYNTDFRLVVACVLTAAVAAYIYYSMKG